MTEICECCHLGNCHLDDRYSYENDNEEPTVSGGILVGGARRLRPMGGCTDYYGSALVGGKRRVRGKALVGGCCGNCGSPVSGSGVYRTCSEFGENKKGKRACLRYTKNADAPAPRERTYGPRKANSNPARSVGKRTN